MMLNKLFKKPPSIYTSDCVCFSFSATDKWDAIKKLTQRMVDTYHLSGQLSDYETLLSEIIAREKNMSTGFEYGIALPHVKTTLVERTMLLLAISPQGIDFDSIDGNPAQIIVIIVSPKNKLEEHMQTMAFISKVLSQEAVREDILQASNPEDVIKHFLSEKTI